MQAFPWDIEQPKKYDASSVNVDETSSDSMHEFPGETACLEDEIFNQTRSSCFIRKTTDPNSCQISQQRQSELMQEYLDDEIPSTNHNTENRQISQGAEFMHNEETIRWQSCCNNPVKEIQWIEKYKEDRRQRYYKQAKKISASSRYYA